MSQVQNVERKLDSICFDVANCKIMETLSWSHKNTREDTGKQTQEFNGIYSKIQKLLGTIEKYHASAFMNGFINVGKELEDLVRKYQIWSPIDQKKKGAI